MIKVTNLVKYYGNHKAVDNISFELSEGKIYGLLGPNGAGKSTTMNIMTGYIGATSGTVHINGHEILDEPELAKSNIGYLPEIPPLYQDMTPHEYLLFVAELKKVPKIERKKHVEEIEEKTKISDVSDRLIKHLSKGYRQRVGLAGALISYPNVIILDEPTVGLDPKQINEMRELISSLRERHTVILSSHILQEVSAVCDEILIITGGKLVAKGTPDMLASKEHNESELFCKIEAESDVCREILSGIGDVDVVSVTEEAGITSCTLTTKNDADELSKKIFFAFAGKEIAILESKINKKSLEDLFLEITNKGKKDGGKSK